MKKVTLTKECHYRPNGSKGKVLGRPGLQVFVSAKDAEDMVKGCVAEFIAEPKPKSAPRNRKKTVKKVK